MKFHLFKITTLIVAYATLTSASLASVKSNNEEKKPSIIDSIETNVINNLREGIINTADRIKSVESKLGQSFELEMDFLDNLIVVTEAEAINTGYQLSPDIASAKSQKESQSWSVLANKRYFYYPNILVDMGDSSKMLFGYQWKRTSKKTISCGNAINCNLLSPPTEDYSSNTYLNPGIQLQWFFFDLEQSAKINASEKLLEAKRLQINLTSRDQIYKIQDTYYDLQRIQYMIKVYQFIIENDLKYYLLVDQNTYHKDGRLLSSSLQIKTQLFSDITTLYALYQRLVSQSAYLAELMGISSDKFVIAKEKIEPSQAWGLNLKQSLEKSLSDNEEILILTATSESEIWKQRELIRSYIPKLLAVGYAFPSYQEGSLGIPTNQRITGLNISNGIFDTYGGIGFIWKFDSLINAANSASARENAEASKNQTKAAILEVANNVKSNYSLWKIGIVNYKNNQLLLNEITSQLPAILNFDKTNINATDLVVITNQFTNANKQYSDSIYQAKTGVAGLHRFTSTWPNSLSTEN